MVSARSGKGHVDIRVRTALAGATGEHIDIEFEVAGLEGHESKDGSLLARGFEAELVECSLDDGSSLVGSPAGRVSIARGRTGGGSKDDLWGDLDSTGSGAVLWDRGRASDAEERDEDGGNGGFGEHGVYKVER
jgi:hypothetical protein